MPVGPALEPEWALVCPLVPPPESLPLETELGRETGGEYAVVDGTSGAPVPAGTPVDT